MHIRSVVHLVCFHGLKCACKQKQLKRLPKCLNYTTAYYSHYGTCGSYKYALQEVVKSLCNYRNKDNSAIRRGQICIISSGQQHYSRSLLLALQHLFLRSHRPTPLRTIKPTWGAVITNTSTTTLFTTKNWKKNPTFRNGSRDQKSQYRCNIF